MKKRVSRLALVELRLVNGSTMYILLEPLRSFNSTIDACTSLPYVYRIEVGKPYIKGLFTIPSVSSAWD